ncbi:type II secretion system F family protein, partial [Vibrio vulnificus]
MATFHYQGRTLDGNKANGQIDAVTSEAAAEQLMNRGIIPVSITQGKTGAGLDFDLNALFAPAVPLEILV